MLDMAESASFCGEEELERSCDLCLEWEATQASRKKLLQKLGRKRSFCRTGRKKLLLLQKLSRKKEVQKA
jgi:hypothetical protein